MYPVDDKILNEMRGSTERASAIVGHAHIEEECTNALCRLLQGDSAFLGNSIDNGFLQTHSARVDLMYLIGAITRDVRDDLRQLAKIRNAFAHNSSVTDFSHSKVAGPLGKIRLLNVTTMAITYVGNPKPSPREQFEFCVGNAVAILRRRFAPIVESRPPVSDEPSP